MIVAKRLYRVARAPQSRSSRRPVGTCWLARGDIAVTARHCIDVEPKTFEIADLGEATLLDEDLEADVAILRLETSTAINTALFGNAVARRATWHADGFPDEVEGELFTMSGHVTSIHQEGPPRSVLQLHLDQGAAGAWEGASGSAIIVCGRVIGVVTEVVTRMSTASGASVAAVRRLLAKHNMDTLPIRELELLGEAQPSVGTQASQPSVAPLQDPWQRLVGRRIELEPLKGAPHAPPPDRVFRVESVTDVEVRFQKESSQQYVSLPRHALTTPWGLFDVLPRAHIHAGRLKFDLVTNQWRWEPGP